MTDDDVRENKTVIECEEVLLIDDRNGTEKEVYFGPGAEKIEKSASQGLQGPLILRIISFLGLLFCFLFSVGAFAVATVMTCFSMLGLFRNKETNRKAIMFWKICGNTLVAAVGFFLGIISPGMGFGFLAIYFALASNMVNDDILRNVIKQSVNRF